MSACYRKIALTAIGEYPLEKAPKTLQSLDAEMKTPLRRFSPSLPLVGEVWVRAGHRAMNHRRFARRSSRRREVGRLPE